MFAMLILALVFFFLACGLAGFYISAEKGRGGPEGLLLGFLFGPFGLLLTVLMPEPASRRRPVLPFVVLLEIVGAGTIGLILIGAILSIGKTSGQTGKPPAAVRLAVNQPDPISVERKTDPALFWVLGFLAVGAIILASVYLRNWPDDQPELPAGYQNTADSQERAEVYLIRKREELEP